MEWLASAVSKIQLSIQESTDEFLAEQAKFCGDAAQLDLPPPPTAPRAPAAELSGDASAGAHGLEHGIGQAEAWLKGRADQFKHVGLVMLNPLGDDEGDDAAVRAAASAAERLPWERPELSAAVRAQMSALSKDHMAFLTMPPEEAPFSFDLTLAMPTILRLLQADPQIERWRFLLVPKRICEGDFFRNYFFQLALLAGDVPPALADAPAPAPPALSGPTARSATPSADSVGGSVVSLVAPSAGESEHFEMISTLEGLGRSQLSECADAVVTQRHATQPSGAPSPPCVVAAAAPAPPAGSSPVASALALPAPAEIDAWEVELQAELARIESGTDR